MRIAWTAAVLAACAGATQPVVVAHVAPVVRRPAPQPTWEAVVVPVPAWSAFVDPTGDRRAVYRAGSEPDGALDLMAGSMRIRVRGDSVEWAHDTTLLPITAHTLDGTRWLFATADGALFRSDTFTGPLTRVADAQSRWFTAGFDSTGNLAVRSDDHHLWIGTNDGTLRLAPSPADGPLVDSGFVDRNFGVAVVAPGRLLRSVDGGTTFTQVDTGDNAPYVVYPNGDQFVLDTTAGLMRIGPSGGVSTYTGVRGEFDSSVPDDAFQAIAASLWSDHPNLRAMLLAQGGVVLSDGRIAAIARDQLYLLDRTGNTNHIDLPGDECDLYAWNGSLLLKCDTDHHATALFTLSGNQNWSELHALDNDAQLVAAPDSNAIVFTGGCDASAPAHAETPLCWYDGVTWRASSVDGRVQLIGVRGDRLLYESLGWTGVRGDETESALRLLTSSDSDNGRPIALQATDAVLAHASYTTAGLLVGIAQRADRLFVAIGPPGESLPLRALPDGAFRTAFADGTRGIAAGRTLHDVWTTTDGGANWARLDLPVDGDASSLPLPRTSIVTDLTLEEISCSQSACVVDGRLVWMAPDGNAHPTGRVFAAQHAPPPPPTDDDRDDPREEGFHAGSASCDQDLRVTGAPLATERLYGGDGWVDLHRTSAIEPQGGRFAMTWGGQDERGRFEATARAGALSPIVMQSGNPLWAQVMPGDVGETLPRYVGRNIALLERCVGPGPLSQCDLVVVPRNALPRVIVMQGNLLAYDEMPVHLRAVLPLPDGGLALHMTPSFIPAQAEDRLLARVDEVVRLDARGEVVARRGFSWSRAHTTRMLARSPHGPGLVVATAPDSRELTLYTLDPSDGGQHIATLPPRSLTACETASTADSLSVSFLADQPGYGAAAGVAGGRFILTGPTNVRSLLEVNPQGTVCLRAVSYWAFNPTDERDMLTYLGGVPCFRAGRHGMEVRAIDRGRTTPVTCQW